MNTAQKKLEWSHHHADSTAPQVVAITYLLGKTIPQRRCEAEDRGNLNPAEGRSVAIWEDCRFKSPFQEIASLCSQ